MASFSTISGDGFWGSIPVSSKLILASRQHCELYVQKHVYHALHENPQAFQDGRWNILTYDIG